MRKPRYRWRFGVRDDLIATWADASWIGPNKRANALVLTGLATFRGNPEVIAKPPAKENNPVQARFILARVL
jgi:hypothetical protein